MSPEFSVLERQAQTQVGSQLKVPLDVTPAQRRATGWPWIYVARAAADLAGGGASFEPSTYMFSTHTSASSVVLSIDTSGLVPGTHLIWVVLGEGKAVVVPIEVVP